MKKKKRFKKGAYHGSVREYVDSEYKDRPATDQEGKVVESLRLSKDEAQWMYDFENEHYGNNHRNGKIYKSQDNYTEVYKKELDGNANSRTRDILNMNRYDKKIIRDLTNVANPAYHNELLSDKLRTDGFEKTIENLIKDVLVDLEVKDMKLGRERLSNMSIDIVRVIKLKQAADRKESE